MVVECPGCHLRYDVTGRPAGTSARCRCGQVFELPAPPAAATLTCPGCGAAASPEATRCEFCAAALATAACPRCFGHNFRGSRHCAHCGAATVTATHAVGEGRARPCPRCAPVTRSLEAQLVAETLLDQCPACGGLWVDQAAFERIVEDGERQQRALSVLGLPPAAASSSSPQPVSYLRCPDCASVMTRKNFGRRSGTVIDLCSAHGVWFDRDELARIIEFVRTGGLDAARRREVESLKEEARAAAARRVSEEIRASLGPADGDPFFGGRRGSAETLMGILGALFR